MDDKDVLKKPCPSPSVMVALEALAFSIRWTVTSKAVDMGNSSGTSRMKSRTSLLKMVIRDSTGAPFYAFKRTNPKGWVVGVSRYHIIEINYRWRRWG